MADEFLRDTVVKPGLQRTEPPKEMQKYNFTSEQDREAARENGRKGGIKSGENRRRNRKLRDAAKFLLQHDLIFGDDTVYDIVRKMGLDDEATNADALIIAAMIKAMKGDVEAMRFVRDTGGEAPKNQVELTGDLDRPVATMDLRALSEEELLRLAEAKETAEPQTTEDE